MSWSYKQPFFHRIKGDADLNLKQEKQLSNYNGQKKVNNVEYKNPQVHLPKHYYRKTVESREKIKENGISKSYDAKNNKHDRKEDYAKYDGKKVSYAKYDGKKVSFEDELVIS